MKKLLFLLLVLGGAALTWYLLIRPYDLQVRMKLRTKPGVVKQLVKLWDKNDPERHIVAFDDEEVLEQQVAINEHQYQLRWMTEMINDSITQIKVRITEPGSAVVNRLSSLITESELEQNARQMLQDFYQLSEGHLKKIRVKIDGIASYPSAYCIYVPLSTSQASKAHGMMANYSLLSTYITENNLMVAGVPFVVVNEWDQENDLIQYDFCYPIMKKDSLPTHQVIRHRQFEGGTALKATYNGNYISSDRAWYELEYEAAKQDLKPTGKIIEYFYDNPNFGGDGLDWRADIYYAIQEQ